MASTPLFAKTNDFGDNFVRTQHLFLPPNDAHANITHANVDNLRHSGIHDIWRFKAFRDWAFTSARNRQMPGHQDYEDPKHDFPVFVYRRMRPALRLATRLLGRARYAFMRIAFAPISKDGHYFSNQYVVTPEMEDSFDDLLRALTRQIRFFHYPFSCAPALGWSWMDLGRESPTDVPTLIGFPQETFLAFARKDWDHLPFSQKDAVSLMFANIMMHELAHTIYTRRFHSHLVRHHHRHGKRAPEPALWRDDLPGEIGAAIERYLWGGRLAFPTQPTKHFTATPPPPAFDGSMGLTISIFYAYEGNRQPNFSPPNYNGRPWCIHPRSLIQFFDTSTYDQHPNAPRNTRGRIPDSTIILSLGTEPVQQQQRRGGGRMSFSHDEALRLRALKKVEDESDDGGVGYAFSQMWWRRRNGFVFGTAGMDVETLT